MVMERIKSKRRSNMSSRKHHCSRRSPLLPMPIEIIAMILVSCLAMCHGFQSIASWSPSMGRATTSKFMRSSSSPLNNNNVVKMSSSPLCSKRSRDIGCYSPIDDNRQNIIRTSISSSSNSRLFPQRNPSAAYSSTSVMMASDDSSSSSNNNVSENKNENRPLLVQVWLSLRKLMAKLWALLFKPFQLLKTLLTNVMEKDKTDDVAASLAEEDKTETTEVEEPVAAVQEEVAITEVENIAVDEEEVEVVEQKMEGSVETLESDVGADADAAAEEEKVEEPITATSSKEEEKVDEDDSRSVSANVDLTGNWTLIVDDAFTSEYDEYLRKLGQPLLVRTVALTVIGSTKEETVQSDKGQRLFIRGTNVRGSWERTLEASEQMVDEDDIAAAAKEGQEVHAVEGHQLQPMTTADGEDVEVASWWEGNGNVHRSWVVGGQKYGGGDFENRRYLTDEGNILVCESTFHPKEAGREDAKVTWRFLREGAIYGDSAVQLPNIFDVLKKEEKDDASKGQKMPKSGLIVGDIMDDVASSEEAETDADMAMVNAPFDHNIIEEAIERESWVPPVGERWAIAAPGVDLTGKWKLIITEQFKKDYDEFLKSLGQPLIVRGAAVVLIGNTREETKQADGGRSVHVKGINAKGIWERTLASSGSDFDTTVLPNPVDGSYDHVRAPIVTADSEKVMAESWWENDGNVHVSWTYGVKRYGGGSFESKRYLENDGNVYVCESTFHPDDAGREKSYLKWKFLREGAAFMLKDQ